MTDPNAPALFSCGGHSEWGEDPYGWQVRLNGEAIDTYDDVKMAEAYVDYMNALVAQ